ncbi:DoxX family protein [Aureisphaera sp. CAU 1614]|uniref:DoxX family protein n=1 Tax=Halomarinibacterium sedimenti TaxID=2857106 RepID=A0A9X1FLB5_9FLAO|nr:DoxX family protein [Halomarinibacterium sedimenti]MBW2936761.1 DoxX family protein [Halomarinibacterium sedimenti]
MNQKQHIGLFLLRASIAFTMLLYGINKLIFGIEYIKDLLDQYGLPTFLSYGVFIGEIIAPILIIIGLRAKLAGLFFGIFCFIAILLDRIPDVLSLNENGGWSIGLIFIYMIFGLSIFFIGAGKYALSTSNKWD